MSIKEKWFNSKPETKKTIKIISCSLAGIFIFFAGFFTYYFTLGKDARSFLWFKSKIQSEYYEDISDEEFWEAAKSGVEGILDDYSTIYTADEYDEVVNSNKGNRVGVGLSFFSGTTLIYKTAINSPCFFAGILEGCFVTGVGKTQTEMVDTFTSTAMNDEFAKYAEGESFCLRISSVSKEDTVNVDYYTIEKKEYTESYGYYATSSESWSLVNGENGVKWTKFGNGISYLQSDTAYVKLVQFYGNAYSCMLNAAKQFKADCKSKLIFDLRNNGGGSVDVMCSISSLFLKNATGKKNLVMRAEYGNGKVEKFYSKDNLYNEYFNGSKIYVMANHNSASASEGLIGALVSYGTVEYSDIFVSKIGESCRTYGKGIMQTTFVNYVTGEAIKLTTAKIYWPNGNCIHGKGVTEEDGATPSVTTAATVYGDPELAAVCSKI